MENLRVGDISSNGQVEIIAEDKLCFLVKSQSNGATGIRTISKALLSEYIQYFLVHPNDNANTAREALSGKTQIDKFEYGYSSTLTVMAKMALANSQNPNYNKCVSKYLLQQIYYGAPGTGKSYTINEVTKGVSSDFVFRTTFHPDSDYSTFVGAYKPTMRKVKNHVSLNLSIDDLAAELNVLYTNVDLGKVGGLQKFCFDYHMYMDGEHITVNVKDLLRRAGISENYSQEIDKYLKFYKLFPKQEEKIAYSFVAQSFLKAYVTAWQNREQSVYLVIEEINRGNCAQIFGDLFQLLDRKEDGVSEYPIKADQDMQDYLKEKFVDCDGLPEKIKSGDELQLPSNLYIWATMNTSDQSLFPIDSAFKRRWDWVYMPIAKGVDKDGNEMNWSIVIGEKSYDWWEFLTAINEVIGTETQSEDKKLGFFFCKADANDEISVDKFVNKVLFYLWNDVFKTCGVEYHYKDGDAEKLLTFDKFHTKDGFDVKKIQDWLEQDLKLDVISIKETREEEEIVGDVKKLTEYQRLRKEYWTKFLNYAREESSAKDDYNRYFGGRKTPSTDKWYNFYFGAKDCHLVVEQTRSSNELYMGLYFDKTTDDFYKLVNSKEAIERELGISFKWNELPEKKSSYICEVTANVDFNDSTDYKRQFDFIIDRLLRMREVFSKYLG